MNWDSFVQGFSYGVLLVVVLHWISDALLKWNARLDAEYKAMKARAESK